MDKVIKDTERDYFMSPDQAKDYGIIDAVYALPGESLIAQAHDAGLTGGEGSACTGRQIEAPAQPDEAGPLKAAGTGT